MMALTLSTFFVCVCKFADFFFLNCAEFNFLCKTGADEKGILACFPLY